MAYTTINKSSLHMNPKDYMGNQSTLNVTGVGFQPDLVWLKKRGNTSNHYLIDAVRGATKTIYSNLTNAEATESNSLTAFGTDGFTLGADTDVNQEDQTQMSWNWKANGAGSVDSSSGSISATVSANTTAGFSIIKFTNPSSGNFTIPHGLGVAPEMLIFKCTGGVQSWFILHKDLSSFTDRYVRFQTADAEINYTMQTQAPTSTLLYLNSGGVSNGGAETICYAFASKTGYSKIGKYIGNGSSNGKGAFAYTGFKPAFIMAKRYDNSSNGNWIIWDNKRDGFNPNKALFPTSTSAELAYATENIDIYSNGFKQKGSGFGNSDGGNFIYYAVGQSLVASNGIPATAR